MNPDKEIESLEGSDGDEDILSVDDFIRQLEEKEKDLHITAETTIIEIAEAFDDRNEIPEFMKPDLALAQAAKPALKADPKLKEKNAELERELKKFKQAASSLETEKKALIESKEKLESDLTELTSDSKRHAKDLANFRSRIERERRESVQAQIADLATKMLPVLDNLTRGLDFALQHEYTKNEEFQPFFEGVFLVNRQLIDVLGDLGIRSIDSVGREFDPHVHEAAAIEETIQYPPNTICEEILKGYKIGEKVIRHAIVKVAKAPSGPVRLAPDEDEDALEPIPVSAIEVFPVDVQESPDA